MERALIKFYKLIRRLAWRLINRFIGIVLSLLSEPVREAVENLWKELKVEWSVWRSRRHFRRFRGKKGIKVQLGSGRDIKVGWVNIDLVINNPKDFNLEEDKDTVLIKYDLRRGLPLEENSCEYIYSSHFFEHLEYKYAVRLLHDCYSALQPGGIFRIVLPDSPKDWEAYLSGDYDYYSLIDFRKKLPDVEPGTEALIDFCNYGIYQRGQHKYCYDKEKSIKLLNKVGFRSVKESSYQEGMDSNRPIRKLYSFYVEGIK